MERPTIEVTPGLVSEFKQKITEQKPKSAPSVVVGDIKQLQQTDSAWNEAWHFWLQKSSGTDVQQNEARQREARKLYDEHSSLRSVWHNWTTMTAGLERLVNLKQIKRSASVRNLIRSFTTHNLLSKYSYLERSNEEITFTEDEEQILAINIAHLQVAFHDVRDFFDKYDRHYMYQEGRIIVLLDKNGRILDFNHHIHPYYKIDLFADEIFESWYKTDVLFRKVMKTNSYLKKLGQKYSTPTPTDIEQIPMTTDEPILFEFVMSLTDQAKFAFCMCADYRDMGMRSSQKQTRILLETLNRINTSNIWNINLNLDEDPTSTNQHHTPPSGSSPVPSSSPTPGTPTIGSAPGSPNMNDNRRRPVSTTPPQMLLDPAVVNELTSKYIRKSLDVKAVNNIGKLRHRRSHSIQLTGKPLKKSIKSFMTTPVIMSPNVLVLLEWMQKEGRITFIRYTKRVKFYMEFIRVWLSQLYESAQSPMNLGLRMLLLGERKMIDVR
eukprot:TRINITY_DN5529_c0_g1_i1.p1 TRINITY_DN5529_c0_g1~~TRINITY_DN5529_c0_g1_i1.p1  ORF type:complete len:494 (-),score=39.50 TRINITY_DN5529_c0_g1_i1:28-1509(-)